MQQFEKMAVMHMHISIPQLTRATRLNQDVGTMKRALTCK